MELARISANSKTGYSHPEYSDALPKTLAKAGMKEMSWMEFLSRVNETAMYRWDVGTICGFLCNQHNKKVAVNLTRFCQTAACQSLFPAGIQPSYEMTTKKVKVPNSEGGSGETLETYHEIIFTQK